MREETGGDDDTVPAADTGWVADVSVVGWAVDASVVGLAVDFLVVENDLAAVAAGLLVDIG